MKKFFYDLSFSFTSMVVPMIVLQLIIYPIVSRRISDDTYGLMITTFSMIMLVAGTFGTEFNNIRLLKENSYKKEGLVGDFNFLLIGYNIISIIVMFIIMRMLDYELNLFSLVVIVLIAALMLINSYAEVAFRLVLDYQKILMSKVMMAVGYLVGLGLFLLTRHWELIYFSSQFCTFIFFLWKTDLLHEGFQRTKLLKETLKDATFLQVSGFLLRAINYADKLLLFPLLGGAGVSIYYTANLFGKIILEGLTPVNNVILSYLRRRETFSNQIFLLYTLVCSLVCAVGYFVCVLISRPVLTILFPQWVDSAMELVPVTTLSICVFAVSSLLLPFTLKFCNIMWQVLINGSTFVLYIICAYSFFQLYGAKGFCFGILLGYVCRLLLVIIIYLANNRKKEKVEVNE
ncbi:MAG: hypothetical protein RR626_08105 [Anaerovoracaceae bacterium]